jgi:hypothetical protein
MRLVSDLNREAEVGDPNAIDRYFPMIREILGIHQAG